MLDCNISFPFFIGENILDLSLLLSIAQLPKALCSLSHYHVWEFGQFYSSLLYFWNSQNSWSLIICKETVVKRKEKKISVRTFTLHGLTTKESQGILICNLSPLFNWHVVFSCLMFVKKDMPKYASFPNETLLDFQIKLSHSS